MLNKELLEKKAASDAVITFSIGSAVFEKCRKHFWHFFSFRGDFAIDR